MRSDLVRLLGLGALVGIGGCVSGTEPTTLKPEVPKFTCLANSATMRLPADQRANLPAFGPRQPDDDFVAISQTVPGGFAGVFKIEGTLILTFVDPATANANRQQITGAFASRGYDFFVDLSKAEYRDARWTFAELDEWFRYIVPRLSAAGVSSLDINEQANTLAFGVIDEDARTRLEARLASLGVSCNLVTTVIQQPAEPLWPVAMAF